MYSKGLNMFRTGCYRVLFACTALLLCACDNSAEQTAPGGINAADAKTLDNAAAKLDAANRLPAPQPASK